MKTILTPVGTSLFTNCLEERKDISVHFERVKKTSFADWKRYERHEIRKLRQAGIDYIKTSKDSASAEIQSVKAIQRQLQEDVHVRLIASDSITSVLAADILSDEAVAPILGDKIHVDFEREKDTIIGLQPYDRKLFVKEGMTNLIYRVNKVCAGMWDYVAFNITGGYKATLPYLTIIAQINHIPLYYFFEEAEQPDSLIRISGGPLSLNIDWGLMERYSDIFTQLEEGIYDWQSFIQKIPQEEVEELRACVEVFNNMAELSPIGRIFWESYKDFFVAEIGKGSYFSYNSRERRQIDKAIEELYDRLDTALRPSYLDQEKCFERIRSLGHNHDLNHGGQINEDTFIFKSTNQEHIRFAYSLRANKKEITTIKIFDILHRNFNHKEYIDDFKRKYKNPTDVDFVIRTFRIPEQSLRRRDSYVQNS